MQVLGKGGVAGMNLLGPPVCNCYCDVYPDTNYTFSLGFDANGCACQCPPGESSTTAHAVFNLPHGV